MHVFLSVSVFCYCSLFFSLRNLCIIKNYFIPLLYFSYCESNDLQIMNIKVAFVVFHPSCHVGMSMSKANFCMF